MSPVRRAVFTAVVFAGTGAYSTSFRIACGDHPLTDAAAALSLAAGAAWIAFGLLLWAATRGRPSLWAWFDACMVVMVVGEVFLLAAAAVNVLQAVGAGGAVNSAKLTQVHAAILLAANLTMGLFFYRAATLMGMTPAAAAFLWFGGLGGLAAAAMAGFAALGVWRP